MRDFIGKILAGKFYYCFKAGDGSEKWHFVLLLSKMFLTLIPFFDFYYSSDLHSVNTLVLALMVFVGFRVRIPQAAAIFPPWSFPNQHILF